jgi:hypothetical protein
MTEECEDWDEEREDWSPGSPRAKAIAKILRKAGAKNLLELLSNPTLEQYANELSAKLEEVKFIEAKPVGGVQ